LRVRGIRQGRTSFERLSPQDASFLAFERPHIHMHVGVVALFEKTSFALPDGTVDVDKFRRLVVARLRTVPRYRQKVVRVPVTGSPVWIDHAGFVVEEHVTETALPAPGDEAALKALASGIFSVPLDRALPLWQMHVVQGLADPDRFAVIFKAAHAMIDGVAGMDFLSVLLSAEPIAEVELAPPFEPTPAPHPARLLLAEGARFAKAPAEIVGGAVRLIYDGDARRSFVAHSVALVRFVLRGIRGTSKTPLTPAPVAARLHDWFSTDRSDERSIRSRLGGTRDDVSLAVTTGAARALLLRAGVKMRRLRVRAMVPLNVRTRQERGNLGNRVSTYIVDLPVCEPDARRRLELLCQNIAYLKQTKQELAVEALAKIDRWTGTLAQRMSMWLATTVRAYNVCVTNIPGPPVPLYALESKLVEIYPFAPVFAGQQINVAALTYLGKLNWGVHYAGTDEAELRRIMGDLQASFDELVAAASATLPRIRIVEPDEAADDAAAVQGL
jgi:diacylglycerol O-acyltransferase